MKMSYLICALPLGLSLTEILLHLLNFAILFTGVTFLVWKPVKKFMENRKAEYQRAEDDSITAAKESQELKSKYENILKDADSEKAKMLLSAKEEAKTLSESILLETKQEAQEIIADSRTTANSERVKVKRELEKEVASLSVSIAGKILDREISDKDNEKLIDECLEEWTKL